MSEEINPSKRKQELSPEEQLLRNELEFYKKEYLNEFRKRTKLEYKLWEMEKSRNKWFLCSLTLILTVIFLIIILFVMVLK